MTTPPNIQITTVASEKDLLGILKLQQANLPENITRKELDDQGFVTLEHNLPLLKKMHAAEKSIVAKSDNQVVGYILAMTTDFAEDFPALSHMFAQIGQITYQHHPLQQLNFIICGQVCVAKQYRGMGLMDHMYQVYRDVHQPKYPMILTEIADHNPRSLKAHLRVGFEIVHSYRSSNGQRWHIVVWDW